MSENDKKEVEVAVEPALFGEFFVAAYIEQELILDRKYYVTSLHAAILVATDLATRYEGKGYNVHIETYGKEPNVDEVENA